MKRVYKQRVVKDGEESQAAQTSGVVSTDLLKKVRTLMCLCVCTVFLCLCMCVCVCVCVCVYVCVCMCVLCSCLCDCIVLSVFNLYSYI